jgi:hypothetical protein
MIVAEMREVQRRALETRPGAAGNDAPPALTMRSMTGIGTGRPTERASMTASGLSQAPRAQRTSPAAIGALVCGILTFCGAAPAGIVAIILGHKALRQIRRTGEAGYGLAKVGLILGYLGLVFTVLGLLIALAASHAGPVTPGTP